MYVVVASCILLLHLVFCLDERPVSTDISLPQVEAILRGNIDRQSAGPKLALSALRVPEFEPGSGEREVSSSACQNCSLTVCSRLLA